MKPLKLILCSIALVMLCCSLADAGRKAPCSSCAGGSCANGACAIAAQGNDLAMVKTSKGCPWSPKPVPAPAPTLAPPLAPTDVQPPCPCGPNTISDGTPLTTGKADRQGSRSAIVRIAAAPVRAVGKVVKAVANRERKPVLRAAKGVGKLLFRRRRGG